MNISPLFTDQYQFTMFESYVQSGNYLKPATFDVFYRHAPDHAHFAIACGLETVLEFLEQYKFTSEDLKFLKQEKFLTSKSIQILKKTKFEADIWTVPEGTPILPKMPFMRLSGPIGLLQLVESPILNLMNFETLIATKANRLVRNADPATITEFGLRRAHGHHAANHAARAAFVGGATSTSNVEAGKLFGIPSRGTMSHAYVQCFDDEVSAFREFVKSYPDSAILLVDTYETLKSGVPNAIKVALELQTHGGSLRGIRLDSGDLIEISQAARHMLDEAGLPDVKIFASNDLDEFQILELKKHQAPVDAYGVGTRLVTSFSEPALGGVYKLVAIQGDAQWIPKMKTTSELHKATLPGHKMLYRAFDDTGTIRADILALEGEDIARQTAFVRLNQEGLHKIEPSWKLVPILHQVWRGTKRLQSKKDLRRVQEYCRAQMAMLPEDTKSIHKPKPIPRLLSQELANLIKELMYR